MMRKGRKLPPRLDDRRNCNKRENFMTSSKAAQKTINVDLNPAPKGRLKALGGSARDEWNGRLSILIAQAMPVDQNNVAACNEAATAALSGLADINPADPIEAMLIAQMVVANEAALALYRRAWLNMPNYFEAGTQFMALADKASRTVALLAERIGQHRGRGQQQITVKHVTVNADQAVVADNVLTARGGVGGKDDGRPHAQAALAHDGMKSPKKKPTAAKLRNWRVAIMRARSHNLGTPQS
jgi:hypothetical protein